MYESVTLPRPAVAARLDLTFRRLGFHNQGLGGDIVRKPYARYLFYSADTHC